MRLSIPVVINKPADRTFLLAGGAVSTARQNGSAAELGEKGKKAKGFGLYKKGLLLAAMF